MLSGSMLEPVRWENGRLLILDQRLLPDEERWIEAFSWQEVAKAIRDMSVRGAPLIGLAAAYGLAMANSSEEAKKGLAATRPTAVNLFHALERVSRAGDPLREAMIIQEEERAANEAIGKLGASLMEGEATVLTICNTGALATPGIGTAMGVIRTLHREGRLKEAIVCESRPRQQGLKLTAWECSQEGIPYRIIPDGAAAWFMKTQKPQLTITGADRIARNGDTANKIGTYGLALAAREHGIVFAVAAPSSTLDPTTMTGADIPIEERDPDELLSLGGRRIAPKGAGAWNPAFDVTPAHLIGAIVTERGVLRPPYDFGV